MAVLSTTAFTLDGDQVLDEAWQRCIGGGDLSGRDGQTGVRAMSLLLAEWQNRHVLSWTVEQATETLVVDDVDYTLAATTVDILDGVRRSASAIDIPMRRLSRQEYVDTPNKTGTGSPHGWYLDRTRTIPVLYVYPVPVQSGETFVYWRIRRIFDQSLLSDPDISPRFMPAFVSGLAWYMARSRPDVVDGNRRAELQADYERDWDIARSEDRERVGLRLAVDMSAYFR